MQSVYVSGAVLYFISPFRVGVFGLICQETCCFLSLEWASPRPEDFFPTGISSPGCTTTLHTSLNFCGLVWNLLISISCKNESWLMTESVFHHRLETDSCPCSLALDLIFLRESAKPFSPVTGCPNVDQLPAVGYKGNRRKESGQPVLRRVGSQAHAWAVTASGPLDAFEPSSHSLGGFTWLLLPRQSVCPWCSSPGGQEGRSRSGRGSRLRVGARASGGAFELRIPQRAVGSVRGHFSECLGVPLGTDVLGKTSFHSACSGFP